MSDRDLLQRLTRAEQCVLTTTDETLFPREFLETATRWQIQAGQVVKDEL